LHSRVYRLLTGYSVFVILVGVASFAAMGPKAKTAVMATVPVGVVVFVLADAVRRKREWSLTAARVAMGFFTLVFLVRTFTGWMSYVNGRPEKLIPAAVITVLGVITAVVLGFLPRPDSAPEGHKPEMRER